MMPDRTIVQTDAAPSAIGPYSQAVKAGGMLYTAGQIPLDPVTGQVVGDGDVGLATERVLENLKAVLEAGGSALDRVVRCDVFLADLGDFAAMNAVYGRIFSDAPPARITVQVARLPKDVRVEIAAIAA
ncbi:MAG: RidA family protein, partial [Planctomycetota bacterium]